MVDNIYHLQGAGRGILVNNVPIGDIEADDTSSHVSNQLQEAVVKYLIETETKLPFF